MAVWCAGRHAATAGPARRRPMWAKACGRPHKTRGRARRSRSCSGVRAGTGGRPPRRSARACFSAGGGRCSAAGPRACPPARSGSRANRACSPPRCHTRGPRAACRGVWTWPGGAAGSGTRCADSAVDARARALELAGEPWAVVIQGLGVGREGVGVIALVRDRERAERRVQKGQAHIEFGAGGEQNLAPDAAPAFAAGAWGTSLEMRVSQVKRFCRPLGCCCPAAASSTDSAAVCPFSRAVSQAADTSCGDSTPSDSTNVSAALSPAAAQSRASAPPCARRQSR